MIRLRSTDTKYFIASILRYFIIFYNARNMFMKGFKKCSNLFMSYSTLLLQAFFQKAQLFLNLYLLIFVWMISFAFHIELGYHKPIHL